MKLPRAGLAIFVLFGLSLAGCGGGASPEPAPGDTPGGGGVIALELDDPTLFVGEYRSVRVVIDPTSGLSMGDLDFEIPAGPTGGEVSLSTERGAAGTPTLTLLGGSKRGTYQLLAKNRATGNELAKLEFEITTEWRDEAEGPNFWFSGDVRGPDIASAWGGGPTDAQNLNVMPPGRNLRVAIVLVDSESQRYSPSGGLIVGRKYLDELQDGVTGGDGVTRSVARWFSENSNGTFTVTGRVFGPFPLDGPFTDHFYWDSEEKGDGIIKSGYFQRVIEAADDAVDYTEFDSVVCVMRTDDSDAADVRFAWPLATIGQGLYSTDEGDRRLGIVSMPSDWDTQRPPRTIHETLSHELGHNLGFGDQYKPGVPMPGTADGRRNLGNWGMMDFEDQLPHLTGAHQMMLGWIDETWIRKFNFATADDPIDETVFVQSIESGPPRGANWTMIEVRIADGFNYYFEFRRAEPGEIGDQQIPTGGRLFGTDVVTDVSTSPIARPQTLILPNDIDGDGAKLDVGDDYEESDFSDPTFPTDFRLEVVDIVNDVAEVRLTYGLSAKPDPSIRPWPAGPDRQWQSPDIEVRNARSAADPALVNLPWAENPNMVVATVRNEGNILAGDVRVEFFVKDFTVGGAPETSLGSDTQDIPARGSVEFTTNWTPPRDGHFCIVARIPVYTSSGGALEASSFNNEAQSNYNQFISGTASPATRAVTYVTVKNPLSKRTRVWLRGGQSNPYFRTFLEHRWLTLDPGELRRVKVMFEFAERLPGRLPIVLQPSDNFDDKQLYVPNNATVEAFLEDPNDEEWHVPQAYAGVQARVVGGRQTEIDLSLDSNVAFGQVRTVDDGKGVSDGGKVVISVETANTKGRVGHTTVDLRPDGTFSADLKVQPTRIHATFLPAQPGVVESDASLSVDE